MVIISNYRQEAINGKIFIRSDEESVCPVCLSELRVIGSKHRKAINKDGVKQTFVIRRFRCQGCGLIHHELPDIFVSFKRHCIDTVESITTNDGKAEKVNTSLAYRLRHWWHTMTIYAAHIMASLSMKCGVVFPTLPSLKQVIRAMVNSHSWIHTRSVRCPVYE
jgi:hypothetical protein